MSDLGIRALEIAKQQLALGIKENPMGSKTSVAIKEYFSKCERNGKLLGITAGNWCAAFVCYCAFTACSSDETPPHLYRAAVSELWADALLHGAAKPASYKAEVGDLAIFARDSYDPRLGGEGHVTRLLTVVDQGGNYQTLDGNHNGMVAIVDRKIDSSLVGWISYAEIVWLKSVDISE